MMSINTKDIDHVKMEKQEIRRKTKFRYLGSIVDEEGTYRKGIKRQYK